MSVQWIGEIKPGGYWKQPDSTRFAIIALVVAVAGAYFLYEQGKRR